MPPQEERKATVGISKIANETGSAAYRVGARCHGHVPVQEVVGEQDDIGVGEPERLDDVGKLEEDGLVLLACQVAEPRNTGREMLQTNGTIKLERR